MIENNHRYIRVGAAVTIGLAAVSGCAEGNSDYLGSVYQATVLKGVVNKDADVYYSPKIVIVDSDASSNRCGRVGKSFRLNGKHIVEPVDNNDPNGRFTGLMMSELPAAVRDDCSADSDGVVWVLSRLVSSRVEKDSVIKIPPLNSQ